MYKLLLQIICFLFICLTMNLEAQVVSLTPNTASPGQALEVQITGENTNFTQGSNTTTILYLGQDGEVFEEQIYIDAYFYTDSDGQGYFTVPSEFLSGGTYDLMYYNSNDSDEPFVFEDALEVVSNPITDIYPNTALKGEILPVSIAGTDFTQGSYTVWFSQGSNTFEFAQGSDTQYWFYQASGTIINAESATQFNENIVNAEFEIPMDAECGVYSTSMLDSQGGFHYAEDNFEVSCGAQAMGRVFYDGDSDGLQDGDENGWNNAYIVVDANGNNPTTLTTDANGNFNFDLPVGTYTLTVVAPDNFEAVPASFDIVIEQEGDVIEGLNFALQATEMITDIQIDLEGDLPVAGFETNYWINVKNIGTTVSNVQVDLVLDELLTFGLDTKYGNAGDTDGDGIITWYFDDLQPNEEYIINLIAVVDVVEFGTLMSSSATVIANGDENLENNVDVLEQEIVSSYDPNDKKLNPLGKYIDDFVLIGEELEYTIRFQNTGNYKALNVRLEDVIDEKLDLSTFRMMGASHEYRVTFQEGRNVVWYFDNINLPDSLSNEPESHGFVTYRIQHFPEIDPTDAIENTAEIYFDFNPAVITNTVETFMVDILPGLSNPIERATGKSQATPNPFTDFTQIVLEGENANSDAQTLHTLNVYDVKGQLIKTQAVQAGNTSIKVDREGLNSGLYFYELIGDKTYIGKLLID